MRFARVRFVELPLHADALWPDKLGFQAEEAEALGITAGTSVLAIARTSLDAPGRPVEASDLLISGDRTSAVYTTPVRPVGPGC